MLKNVSKVSLVAALVFSMAAVYNTGVMAAKPQHVKNCISHAKDMDGALQECKVRLKCKENFNSVCTQKKMRNGKTQFSCQCEKGTPENTEPNAE